MHIIFLNPQGNFDRSDSYWTMHPDFGGQLVYVKEIAIQMALKGHKIDIITRKIDDINFKEFNDEFDSYQGIDNLRIIRIPCGGDSFLRKELLWEHLNEWTDNIISFYHKEGKMFEFATGHYGDGGLACALIKEKMGIPFSFTGHSLGAQKLDKLYALEKDLDKLDKKYHFTKRIIAEQISIQNSSLIFVSTTQERDEQYTHKLYSSNRIVVKLPKFFVAPPGANTQVFDPFKSNKTESLTRNKIELVISRDISKSRIELPYIIAASRLDPKKNHIGLLKAYASSEELQNKANLAISLRGIENAFNSFENASEDEVFILNEMIDIVKQNNLIGKVMFVNINSQNELASFYRILAKRKSIFTLTALYEPFGLAPIEAMCAGLPVAVTKNGGPSEVLKEGKNQYGVLIDPNSKKDIANGIIELFDNYDYYKKVGFQRVIDKYTWSTTADIYLDAINHVITEPLYKEDLIINKYFIDQDSTIEENYLRSIYIKKDEVIR